MWDAVRKTKRLIAGLLLALLLAGGHAFASNVTGAGNTTTSGTAQTVVNATSNATLQDRAYYMLTLLNGVANYTTELIDNLSAVDNETMNLYAKAENLRQSAWAAYDMANYSAAITVAMNAMEVYELVIERAMPANLGTNQGMGGMGNSQEALYWAKIELQRAREYLAYVSRIIDEATKLGIDTSEISALYSQTVEAYNRVEADIKNGDVSSLRDNMRRAESLRMQLEMAVENDTVRAILMASADDITQTFMKKIEAELNRTAELMEIISNLTADGTGTGMMNMLQMRQMEIQRMLEMVKSAVQAGQYERALYMIREINEELSEAIMEISTAAIQFRDTYMGEYCGNYLSNNYTNGTQDYPQYCDQSWWAQWERGMGTMTKTGWWNEEESHMGRGMGSMGGWNGPWWSDSEHGMTWGNPINGSMSGSWMGQGHGYWWNGADYETPHDEWSEYWTGNQNGTGNWTSNQTSSINGNTTHGSMGDNHMNDDTTGGMDDMNNGTDDSQEDDQDNHMEDSSDDSGSSDGCGNCNGGGNDDHDNGGGNGSWGNWWGG